VAQGVFVKGIDAAMGLYTSVTIALRSRVLRAGSDWSADHSRQLQLSPEFELFSHLYRYWLSHAARVEARLYHQQQESDINRFVAMRKAMVAAFLTALAICFVIVFEPMVLSLDMHVKRVRALLVLIPVEVILSTASLKKALLTTA